VAFTGFPDAAFAFYEGLGADNSKTYWTAHKHVYDTAVRAPMLALVEALAPEYGDGKLFRPHRDVRFSSDKSPYKNHQGAFFDLAAGIGYYVQIDADGLFTAAGFHTHSREQTARYRAAVDADTTGKPLDKIMSTLDRQGFTREGDRVRTRPRGCPPDHPRLELMRHESLVASRRRPPGPELESSAALAVVRGDWRKLAPLVDWIMDNVGPA
jgi:uncharacterized protein (TIGR02453 family)